jgi:CheY-like chemotaxis protein/nitrogen-specific signal transduction histidine kinase
MDRSKTRSARTRTRASSHKRRATVKNEPLLESLIRSTADTTGRTFFRRLADELAHRLHIRAAIVSRLSEPAHISILASSEHTQAHEGTAVPITEALFRDIILSGQPLVCPKHARRKYPNAKILDEFHVEGLIGIPLASSTDRMLGAVLLLHNKPLRVTAALLTPLTLVASRAAAELERMEIEEQRMESEYRMREIVDAAPFGAHLYTLQENGELVFVGGNHSADLILGVKHHELIGLKIEEAFPGLADQGIPDAYRTVARAGTPFERDFISYTHGQISGVFEVHAFQTSPHNMCAFFRDITERRKAELHAEEASRVKTSLLRNISHEFRTPITGILGITSLLRSELHDMSHHHMLDGIAISAKRLHTTLDAILKLAQLISGEMRPARVPIDPEAVCLKLQQRFAAIAAQKGITLTVAPPRGDAAILGDEEFVLHALGYLVDNGVKYTASGGVTVRTDMTLQGNDTHCVFTVQDTGIGIAPEYQELIFEEFKQASEGYSRQFEGSGLGLAIARRMIWLMNGTIDLVSSPGSGSTFFVSLPATAAPEQLPPPSPPSAIETPDVEEKPRVLIVEDNFINEMVMQNFLSGVCTSDHASNARSAIDMAQTIGYAAIIMDINLGAGMSGIEATQEIRKIPGYQSIPIIAITGYTLAGDRERILSQGLTHYLPKPFDRKEIVEIVSSALYSKLQRP